jgi:hypothetical protein
VVLRYNKNVLPVCKIGCSYNCSSLKSKIVKTVVASQNHAKGFLRMVHFLHKKPSNLFDGSFINCKIDLL